MLRLLLLLTLGSGVSTVELIRNGPHLQLPGVSVHEDTVVVNPSTRPPPTFSHSFTYPSSEGRPLEVDVTGELGETPVIVLDRLLEVVHISQPSASNIVVTLNSTLASHALARHIRPGTIITGTSTANSVVLGKATSRANLLSTDERSVTVQVTPTHYAEAFKNLRAKLNIHSAHMKGRTADQFDSPHHTTVDDERWTENNGKVRKMMPQGFWSAVGSFLKAGWNAVKHVAHLGATVAKTVYHVVKAVVTGDLDWKSNTSHQLAFNYNAASGNATQDFTIFHASSPSGGTAAVECTNCFFHMETVTSIVVEVEDYTMNVFRAVGELSATLNLEIDASSTIAYHADFNRTVATVDHSWAWVIYGVPLTLRITIPVFIGAEVSASIAGSIAFEGQATGSLVFGIEYFRSNSSTQPIWQHRFSNTKSIHGADKGTVTVRPYILPVVNVIIEHIGGPYVTWKSYLEVGLGFGDPDAESCPVALLTVNVGTQMAIGAEIDVYALSTTIYTKDFGSHTILNVKKGLYQACVSWKPDPVSTKLLLDDGTPEQHALARLSGPQQAPTWTTGKTWFLTSIDGYLPNPVLYEQQGTMQCVDGNKGYFAFSVTGYLQVQQGLPECLGLICWCSSSGLMEVTSVVQTPAGNWSVGLAEYGGSGARDPLFFFDCACGADAALLQHCNPRIEVINNIHFAFDPDLKHAYGFQGQATYVYTAP